MNTASQVETLSGEMKTVNQASAGLKTFVQQFMNGITWTLKKIKFQPARKTLRLCENLPLGEKRFVAVIQVENEKFLIGGAAGSVSLLTRLQETQSFSESLQNKLKEEAAR